MDQKQYEVMSLIMAKGRKFLDEIYKLMSDSGLLDEKYEVHFEISNTEKVGIGCDYLKEIELIRNYHFEDGSSRMNNSLSHWDKDGKGWVFWNDPLGKNGPVPDDDGIPQDTDLCGAESGTYPAGETPEQNAPSGNGSLWFHDDDGDPPMVCRGDLNGSMAESDPGR